MSAAAELFVKVSADVGSLSKGLSQAGDEVAGLGAKVDQAAHAFKLFGAVDTVVDRTRIASEALGKSFNETAVRTHALERAIAEMVSRGIKPGNESFDKAVASLKQLREAAAAAVPRVDQTADGFKVIQKNSDAFDVARKRAKLLGDTFDDTSERVKFARQAVNQLVDMGLKPGDAALDRAVVKLRQAQAAHQQTAQSAQVHTKETSLFNKALQGLTIAAVGSGLLAMGKKAITLAGELETARVGFTTMLGSAEKADKFLRDLAQFAAETPFELRGLQDSSKRLLAFGFSAEGIIPIMTAVGNAVSGLGGGKDALDGITLALGQMAAKGKVSAEEMNQLAGRGVPAYEMLAKSIGVSVPEAMKMAEKGAINANQAIVAIINGMNERFPDMMKKQSSTFAGAMSNLVDATDQLLTTVGDKLMKALFITPAIQKISAAVSSLNQAIGTDGLIKTVHNIQAAFSNMGAVSKAVIVTIGIMAVSQAIPALVSLAASALRVVPAIASIGVAAALVAAKAILIGAAAYVIIKNWDSITGAIGRGLEKTSAFIGEWVSYAASQFSRLTSWVSGLFSSLNKVIVDTFGVDIAAKLGMGMAKASAAVGTFKKEAALNFAIVKAGAIDLGNSILKDFGLAAEKGISAVTGQVKKVTEASLGLKPAVAAATDSVKKSAAAKKEAAVAAKELAQKTKDAAQETKSFFKGLAGFINSYRDQVKVSKDFAAAIQEVEKQAAAQGRSFDLAGAKATVFKQNIKDIEKAFGEFSVQAVTARANMAAYAEASANGGAATAQAYSVIDDATKALENQAFAAQALGKEWDAAAEGIKSAEGVLTNLINKGLRPGNKAYDDAAAKLKEVRAALVSKQSALVQVSDAMGGVLGAINNVLNNLGTLANAFGVEGAAAAIKFAKAGVDAAIALAQIPASITTIGNALTGLSALFVTNPILAAILAIVGTIVIAGAAMYQWWKTTQEEARKTAEETKKVNDEAAKAAEIARANDEVSRLYAERQIANNQRIAESYKATMEIVGNLKKTTESAVKMAALEFMAGVDDWAKNLEFKLKQAMFNGLMDRLVMEKVMGKLNADFDAIGEAVVNKNYMLSAQLTSQLAEKVKGMVGPVAEAGKLLLQGLGLVPGEASRVLDDALGRARGATTKADQGSRGAVESYLRAQMDALTNLRNRGIGPGTYEYEVTADQARAAARQLQNMATGGLVTGPTMARLGEGGRPEAVLPLNENVYRQIGQGIAAARGGGGGAQVVVQYYGNGKWTREDAQGLGRMLVSELRTMGVKA